MNNFAIQITAVDKATAVFRKVNTQMALTMRPITRAQRTLVSLGREMHLDKLTKGMHGLSQAGMKVASSLGLAAGPMEAIFGLGAAGGIVAAGSAVAALASRWGNLGFEINRTSQTIGVTTADLQRYRGAAKLAGLSQDDLTKSFAALGTALQDASAGRPGGAALYTILNRFGIGIKRTKDGVVDTVGTFMELSRVISQIPNPQVQELVANIAGVGAMLPLLRQGPAAIAALTAEAQKFGLVAGGEALSGSQAFGDSMNRLKVAIEGVANAWGSKLTPMVTRGMDSMTSALTKGGLGGAIWNILSGKATRDAVFSGAAPGMQRSSGVVTGGLASGSLPLGLPLNNPGNLRIPGSATGFQSFDTPQSGLNAMAQQIGRYANRDGLHTLRGVISKYAPASENNTGAYLADASKQTGVGPDDFQDFNDPKRLAPLLSAMVKHEQGRQPFSADQYAQAAQTVNIHVAVANAPPGTRVSTTGSGAAGARVSYALPLSDAP